MSLLIAHAVVEYSAFGAQFRSGPEDYLGCWGLDKSEVIASVEKPIKEMGKS